MENDSVDEGTDACSVVDVSTSGVVFLSTCLKMGDASANIQRVEQNIPHEKTAIATNKRVVSEEKCSIRICGSARFIMNDYG